MSAQKFNLFKAIDFILRIESGPDQGKAFKISPPHITIGREATCQVRLNDPKVSRKQCRIVFADNIVCEDLSTKQTTRVNGKLAQKTVLKPGDKISFGQTIISFNTRTNQQAQPQLAGQVTSGTPQTDPNKRRLMFMGVIGLLVLALLFLDEGSQNESGEKLATNQELVDQVNDSRNRQSTLREQVRKKRKLGQDDYLHNVENHFIAGFRDFQNGRFGRAINSFGTTMASDRSHARAARYARAARKKRDDLIETHLNDGQKYKEKLMYNRCAAEFKKAMIYINDQTSQRYQLAKEKHSECKLLQTGGYR